MALATEWKAHVMAVCTLESFPLTSGMLQKVKSHLLTGKSSNKLEDLSGGCMTLFSSSVSNCHESELKAHQT